MQAVEKSAESGHTGSTAVSSPLRNTVPEMGRPPNIVKEKPIAKKRKGEAEKLLPKRNARPTRRAMARQKEVGLLGIGSSYMSGSCPYSQVPFFRFRCNIGQSYDYVTNYDYRQSYYMTVG